MSTDQNKPGDKTTTWSQTIKDALAKHDRALPLANDINVRPIEGLDADHKKAQTDDLKLTIQLKEFYAKGFIWILVGQLVVMNAIFVCVGFHVLVFTDYVLHLYMGGTLAEVFGIVLVITRYLFPKR